MAAAHARHGRAVLTDWHSMPAQAAGGPTGPDVVLGERNGTSCATRLTRDLRTAFERLGWRVALNQPYPGGYSTRISRKPDDGFSAIQIELNRGLYFDKIDPGAGTGLVALRQRSAAGHRRSGCG